MEWNEDGQKVKRRLSQRKIREKWKENWMKIKREVSKIEDSLAVLSSITPLSSSYFKVGEALIYFWSVISKGRCIKQHYYIWLFPVMPFASRHWYSSWNKILDAKHFHFHKTAESPEIFRKIKKAIYCSWFLDKIVKRDRVSMRIRVGFRYTYSVTYIRANPIILITKGRAWKWWLFSLLQ